MLFNELQNEVAYVCRRVNDLPRSKCSRKYVHTYVNVTYTHTYNNMYTMYYVEHHPLCSIAYHILFCLTIFHECRQLVCGLVKHFFCFVLLRKTKQKKCSRNTFYCGVKVYIIYIYRYIITTHAMVLSHFTIVRFAWNTRNVQ